MNSQDPRRCSRGHILVGPQSAAELERVLAGGEVTLSCLHCDEHITQPLTDMLRQRALMLLTALKKVDR